MEDIVDLHVGWKFQGAGGRRWGLDDLEWVNESGLELRRGVDVLEVNVMSGEAHHVTNRVGDMTPGLVGIMPLAFLGLSNGCWGLRESVMDGGEAGCSRWVGGVNDE